MTTDHPQRALVAEWLCHWCATLWPALPGTVPASQLYREFTSWARRFGRPAITQTAFGRALTDLGIVGEKRVVGYTVRIWRTLRPNRPELSDAERAA